MIIRCFGCGKANVIPGQRNKTEIGLCGAEQCKTKAIVFLKEKGLATEAELESIGPKLDSAEGK